MKFIFGSDESINNLLKVTRDMDIVKSFIEATQKELKKINNSITEAIYISTLSDEQLLNKYKYTKIKDFSPITIHYLTLRYKAHVILSAMVNNKCLGEVFEEIITPKNEDIELCETSTN